MGFMRMAPAATSTSSSSPETDSLDEMTCCNRLLLMR